MDGVQCLDDLTAVVLELQTPKTRHDRLLLFLNLKQQQTNLAVMEQK